MMGIWAWCVMEPSTFSRYNTMMFITTKREEFARDREILAMLRIRDDYAGINLNPGDRGRSEPESQLAADCRGERAGEERGPRHSDQRVRVGALLQIPAVLTAEDIESARQAAALHSCKYRW